MCKRIEVLRNAASLILAAKSPFSTGNANFKILCLKRSSSSGFMPNNYVFPGGNISESDGDIEWLKIFKNFNSLNHLYPKENIPKILLDKNNSKKLSSYLSLRICAIRETFEESGILICKKNGTQNNKSGETARKVYFIH